VPLVASPRHTIEGTLSFIVIPLRSGSTSESQRVLSCYIHMRDLWRTEPNSCVPSFAVNNSLGLEPWCRPVQGSNLRHTECTIDGATPATTK
ncbi:hypothetical protein BDN67DRAFT_971404, partial [Paxillus ammoniavirescens]